MQRGGAQSAADWYRLGSAALDRRDLRAAEDAFRRVISADPSHANARVRLAQIAESRREFQQAAQPFPDPLTAREPPEANPVLQTAGSIVSAVLLTTIVAALGASPAANLIVAALGVMIPQFVAYVGPWRRIRLGVAVVVTIVALVFTYGGVKLFDAATETTTFPDPVPTATPTPPPTPTPQPIDGRAEIRVSPEQLQCTASGCDSVVTIESTGPAQLRTLEIEFEGADASLFRRSAECVNKAIPTDAPCRFTVTFVPTSDQGTGSATLVIHENVHRDGTRVSVEGGPAATGNAEFDGTPTCVRAGGALAVAVTATASTPGQLAVTVLLTADGSTLGTGKLTTGETGIVPLREEASGQTVTVQLETIQGDNPSDNATEITCAA
jgi:tetratricopeptide repeat protein